MDVIAIEVIEKEAEEATARFANRFHNGEFDKFESHNQGPDYNGSQNGKSKSMLSEDEKHFMEFLRTPFAKKLMKVE